MKVFKKFISTVLIICLIFTCFSIPAYAFGGYAHWYMGNHIASLSNKSATAKLAYKSGCLLADIGRISWDDEYEYNSDSYNMSLSMFLLVDVYPDEFDSYAKYMYCGWRDHYHQDQYGSVNSLNPPHNDYKWNCGWIDEYLRDDLENLDYPIRHNDFDELYIDYELISRAYELLCGFAPTETQIKNQIRLMFAAYDFQISMNFTGWDETDKTNIINELDRCVNYCYGFELEAPDYMHNSRSTESIDTNSSIQQTMDLLTEEDLELLASYIEIEETNISETASYLKINITDQDEYDFQINNILMEKY